MAEGREIKSELATLEAELATIEGDYMARMKAVPNIIFDDVPLGGEEDSVEVKRHGDQPIGAIDHV